MFNLIADGQKKETKNYNLWDSHQLIICRKKE